MLHHHHRQECQSVSMRFSLSIYRLYCEAADCAWKSFLPISTAQCNGCRRWCLLRNIIQSLDSNSDLLGDNFRSVRNTTNLILWFCATPKKFAHNNKQHNCYCLSTQTHTRLELMGIEHVTSFETTYIQTIYLCGNVDTPLIFCKWWFIEPLITYTHTHQINAGLWKTSSACRRCLLFSLLLLLLQFNWDGFNVNR